MDNNENLTPEELEMLQNEEAQQKTGPNLHDRMTGARNAYNNLQKVSRFFGKTGLAGNGAQAATKMVVRAILSILPIIGTILLIVLGIALVGVIIASIYYSIVNPISTKYSVDEEAIVNEYDNNDIKDDAKDENGNLLSDSSVGGIRNILKTDDMVMDELFGDVPSNKLTIFEEINARFYEWFGVLFGGKYSGPLINKIIEINLEKKLNEMGIEGELDKMEDYEKEKLPLGALITTFSYAYSSQYLSSEGNQYEDVIKNEDGETEEILVDRINPTTPISMIAALFEQKILTLKNPDDIGDLLDHMVFHEFYPTYSWQEINKVPRKDEAGNIISYTIYMGCVQSDNESYDLDYYKYYLYLRYGAYVSGFAVNENSNEYEAPYSSSGATQFLWGKTDVTNYKEDSNHTVAFGYEYFKNLDNAYRTSSEECRLKTVAEKSLEDLQNEANKAVANGETDIPTSYYMLQGESNNSVDTANNFFKKHDVTDGNSVTNLNHEIFSGFSKYDEKADIYSTGGTAPKVKIDNSVPSEDESFVVNAANGEEYEYEHGWIYNRYPFYREEFQVEENDPYEYDEVSTPKTIERQISDIASYKDIFNSVLGYENKYVSKIWSNTFNSDGSESFPLPVGQYKITSCVGERVIDGEFDNHGGIDIAVARDTAVYAWKSGTVVRTNNSCGEGYYGSECGGGYGNFVVIDHGEIDGEKQYSLYAHLKSVSVVSKSQVSAGQQIGVSGNSGSSTGPHLHFEIRTGGTVWSNSTKQDPYPTLAEIVGGENLPDVCVEGTIFNVESTLMDGNISRDESKKQLCQLLVNHFSQNGAIALMANAAHESSYDIGALGDSGTSYGLFQWHNTRMDNLKATFPNSYNTVQSQFEFLLIELDDYSSLNERLVEGNKSSEELAYDFCYEFERPKNKEISCENRMVSYKYVDAKNYVENGCQSKEKK